MRAMKDMAIVCNIGHFDNEIQVAGLRNLRWTNVKPQVDMIDLPRRQAAAAAVRRAPRQSRQRHRPSELRHERLVHQSGAGADRAVGQQGKYENKVYMLPKALDERVARLHLEKLGVKLTQLSKEQADYIGVPLEGPYKSDHYRY